MRYMPVGFEFTILDFDGIDLLGSVRLKIVSRDGIFMYGEEVGRRNRCMISYNGMHWIDIIDWSRSYGIPREIYVQCLG